MSRRVLVIIVVVAALLRCWAALQLPLDYDEPVYLQAGYDYAERLEAGDWDGVIDYAENREHPPLVKLLYGLAVLVVGQDASWMLALYASRVISVLFGTLAVSLLALVDPLAGALLAGHTLVVKYTSQAYLEALPHFASLAAVLAFYRATAARDRRFWLSALALGLTAAGKFAYLPVVLTIFYLAVWEKKFRWRDMLLYVVVAVAVFWLLNPTLWRDPFSRLGDQLFFHVRYSQSSHVQQSGYPWYQPLHWISRSPPSTWHPQVFFYFGPDGLVFLLALVGLYWGWRERRWVVVWIVTALVFLVIWPTKWPQYTLVLVPALCLAAATAARQLYQRLKAQEEYWTWLQLMLPRPSMAFWVLALAFGAALIAGYTALNVQLTLARLKWSQLTTRNARLPSNTIYDVVAAPGEQMALATEHGAVLWTPAAAIDLPDARQVFTAGNSGLPHDRVLAVARDPSGDLWFGTQAGLGRYDGSGWQTYRAKEFGLRRDQVHALAVGGDGRLWVGTNAGAAVFDGQGWTGFTAGTSGLTNDWVLSLAIQGDWVWFGTKRGVDRLDTATGEWVDFTAAFDPAWGGVVDLTFDADGRLWAGTLGGGLGLWDGTAWQFSRTSNSDIPFNTVNEVTEVEPGVLWVGLARPASVGGLLAEFDGQRWTVYDAQNSGYSEAEPLAIALDHQGRRWVGTRTTGIEIYQADR